MEDGNIIVLQRKFYEVYNRYHQCNPDIVAGHSENLMISCLCHLVPFCSWARMDDPTSEWIHNTLLQKADLRPEVRNGIALIIIYCFASAQAYNSGEDIDMFGALQDSDRGLGIVNKTSVKIYNDPFHYFEFLKCCISGLIMARAIPENERQNKPKKQKSAEASKQNVDEINAYYMLSRHLIDLLADGQRDRAHSSISQILIRWHNDKQQIRNCRFTAALDSLATAPEPVEQLHPDFQFGDMDDNDDLMIGFSASHTHDGNDEPPPVPTMGRFHSLDLDFLDIPATKRQRDESHPSGKSGGFSVDSAPALQKSLSTASSHSKMPPHFHPPLQVMRLVRVSDTAWAVTVHKVYHLQKVLNHVASDVFLVDEKMFSPEEWRGMKISRRCVEGNACIEAELEARNMLVAQWSRKDHEQLVHLVSSWTHTINERYQPGAGHVKKPPTATPDRPGSASPPGEHIPSLIAYWCVGALSMPCRLNSFGALAYEEVAREGLVIRANAEMGLTEDVWNLHYVQDFARTTSQKESFLDLLLGFFPQLSRIASKRPPPADGELMRTPFSAEVVVVKYACHKGVVLEDETGVTHVPAKLNSAAYQTLGLLTSAADVIPSRFEFHTPARLVAYVEKNVTIFSLLFCGQCELSQYTCNTERPSTRRCHLLFGRPHVVYVHMYGSFMKPCLDGRFVLSD